MATLTGGELVVEVLAREGVRHLFTLCGGHILPIYDACLKHGIAVIDVLRGARLDSLLTAR